jgi:hypothetical protein
VAGLSPPGGPGSDRVGESDGSEGDRGQIILVTAFALAVAFVALSVVINGAIFTQNLATRGDTAGGGDALQQRQQAEQMVGDLLEHENEDSSPDDQDLEEAIRELGNASSYQQSVAGRAVNYTAVSTSNGTRVFQSSPGNFSNTTGANNWTVAESVGDTRRFDIDVTDTGELEDPGDKPFAVTLTNASSGDTWQLVLTEDSNITLTTTYVNGTDSFSRTCTASSSLSDVTVNVTGGLFAGKPCPALAFARNVSGGTDGLGTYNVHFNNTQNVKGTYSLTVNTTAGTADAPNDEEILYSATVQYTYRTANLVYETDIRVAPGEPDD